MAKRKTAKRKRGKKHAKRHPIRKRSISRRVTRHPLRKSRVARSARSRVKMVERVAEKTVRKVVRLRRNPVRPLPPPENLIMANVPGLPQYFWTGKKFSTNRKIAKRYRTRSGAIVIAKELIKHLPSVIASLDVVTVY